MRNLLILLFGLLFFWRCSDEEKSLDPGIKIEKSEDEKIKDYAEKFNKAIDKEDREIIENYLENKDWDIKETGSGIYYYIFNQNDSLKPVEGDYVTMSYLISSLDSDTLYSSEMDGNASFVVGKEDLESGIHEAVQLLGIGDEGIFILVNSRAHGVLGDQEKILPYQVLVYKLKLLSIE